LKSNIFRRIVYSMDNSSDKGRDSKAITSVEWNQLLADKLQCLSGKQKNNVDDGSFYSENVSMQISDNGKYLFVLVNDLNFSFSNSDRYIFSQNIINENFNTIREVELVFFDCNFSKELTELGYRQILISSTTSNLIYTIVTFSNCKFNNSRLTINSTKMLRLLGCKIDSLVDDGSNTLINIKDCTIDYVKLSDSLRSVDIQTSEIGNIDLSDILIKNSLINLYLDEKTTIKVDTANTYKKIQNLIKKDILYSKIQHHILYTKELEAYTNEGKSIDDKLLFMFNNILNKHGRSVLRPLAILFIVNLFFIFWFNVSNSIIDTYTVKNWLRLLYESLLQSLDVSPLNSYPAELSKEMRAVDGLRKILLAVISYNIISAAIRFKFKN
jgi:hypothetical protein